jgi:hypothetical protein
LPKEGEKNGKQKIFMGNAGGVAGIRVGFSWMR